TTPRREADPSYGTRQKVNLGVTMCDNNHAAFASRSCIVRSCPRPSIFGRRFRSRKRRGMVAVGTPVARRPPHRSVQALLTHTAPTSGAWRRSGRPGKGAGPGSRDPEISERTEACPVDARSLTAPPQCVQPVTETLPAELVHARRVAGDSVVVEVL